ncbi:MAG: amidohydrolase family protein [Gemmatimonadota bacterium]
MRAAGVAAASLLLLGGAAGCGAGPEYDLVIEGGRVIDPESGLDAVRNVGIRRGRVEILSKDPLSGRRVIEARGLVVAPGFIDLHRHGQDEGSYRLQVRDGVTTGLDLELGTPNVQDWYEAREPGQIVNYGVSVGHLGARATAVEDPVSGIGGRSTRVAATERQRAETERLLRVGLAQGAIGIGFGAAYTSGAGMDELEQMFTVASERRVAAFIHTRNGLAGLDSILEVAGEVGASLHVVHANSSGGEEVLAFLERIEAARAAGQDVTTEAYPYGASQTLIQSAPFDGWESWPDTRFRRYEWANTGERLTRERFALLKSRGGGSVIIYGRTEDLTLAAVTHPLTMVASDGGGRHPRGAGTFARILGRYVREGGALSLMDALARMTIRPAQRLESFVPAMANKGRIRVGADADITIFDPATVIDRATYGNGFAPSEGFRYVLVNGVVVVDGGRVVEGARPGRAVFGVASY